MEEKEIEKLVVFKDLTTVFYSRILFPELWHFDAKNILDIKYHHWMTGFQKTMLAKETGQLYMFYNSKGHYPEPKQSDYWEELYENIKKSKLFLEEYKLSSTAFVFKVKFPERFMKDYKLIMSGKYSMLSKSYMNYYPDKESLLYHLYHKTPIIKEAYAKKFKLPKKVFDNIEIGPKIDKEKETFNLDLKINV